LAKGKYVANDAKNALRVIENCLGLNDECSEAHILAALINSKTGNTGAARSNLENAMAISFGIRENPLFMLVKGQVEIKSGEFTKALETLKKAIALPGVKSGSKKKSHSMMEAGPEDKLLFELSIEDRAALFTCLIQVYAELNQLDEAKKVVHMAIPEFSGTSEEVKILVANSEVALKSGDIKKALNMLKQTPKDSAHFKEIKIAMANIYLSKMMDRRQYAKCYSDIVEANPSTENYVLLGAALMKIQEPEEAIKAYEKALESKSDDPVLAREIGKALVQTHDYQRATNYYETALRADPRKADLRIDLARLYLRLKDYNQCMRVLSEAIDAAAHEEQDFSSLSRIVQAHLLTARTHLLLNQNSMELRAINEVEMAYADALKNQSNIIELHRDIGAHEMQNQRELLSEIHYKSGEYYEGRIKDLDRAFSCYMESLRYNDRNEKSIMALAHLHVKKGELDLAQNHCNNMLRINPSHEGASVMLAELMLQKQESEKAVFYLKQLLDNKADNYRILSQLIQLVRRAGNLEEAEKYLKMAEKASKKSNDAGLYYCKGLFHRYKGEPQLALQSFNNSRRDGVFGEESINNMVEIYLNPDNEPLWANSENDSIKLPSQSSLKAVGELITELKEKGFNPRIVVYETYSMMITREKRAIESAIQKLQELLNTRKDYVPAIVALATAKLLNKKAPDARNQLKIIAKKVYQPEYAEEYERAWLMLADIYVSTSKYDLGEELCAKSLKYNKSCGKAEEYFGLIKEKEQSYQDAADHYEKAWKLASEKSASIGFRLSFNYLKAKRYIECIEVCKAVLKEFPEYPKIEKEILTKARHSLRA